MTDRTPAILSALVNAYHDAEDLQAAAALDRAVDLPALADLLPIGEADRALADGLRGLIVDGNDGEELADADWAIACRVAARLAVTAVSLLAADPKRNLSDAETLWAISGKLSGLWEATADAMREEERRRNGPMVNIAETYRLAAEQWKARAEKAEAAVADMKPIVRESSFDSGVRRIRKAMQAPPDAFFGCVADHVEALVDDHKVLKDQVADAAEQIERLQEGRSSAAWEATQGAHALAMVGGAVGLTNLPRDPLDAAKAIIETMRPAPPAIAAKQRTPWPPGTRVAEGSNCEDTTTGTVVSDDGGDTIVVRWDYLPANSPGVRVARLVQIAGGADGDIMTAPKY